jgi:hypothetical protein
MTLLVAPNTKSVADIFSYFLALYTIAAHQLHQGLDACLQMLIELEGLGIRLQMQTSVRAGRKELQCAQSATVHSIAENLARPRIGQNTRKCAPPLL